MTADATTKSQNNRGDWLRATEPCRLKLIFCL